MGCLSQLMQKQFIRVQRDLRKYTNKYAMQLPIMPVKVIIKPELTSINSVNPSFSPIITILGCSVDMYIKYIFYFIIII